MPELEFDHLVLRYCRQIILKTMDHVRGAMRGENRLSLKRAVANPQLQKSPQNLTKAVDRDTEDLILDALQQKFTKLPGVKAYTAFSEELGIKTFPEDASVPGYREYRSNLLENPRLDRETGAKHFSGAS